VEKMGSLANIAASLLTTIGVTPPSLDGPQPLEAIEVMRRAPVERL
jgi:hypothetical protein